MSERRRSTPDLEAQVAFELTALVEALPVGAEFTIEPDAKLCSSLERFLPELLRRRYSVWKGESLDGVFVARARKTGPVSTQLAGTCILISDQTVTPFSVDLVSSPSGECLASFRVCLGEPGRGPLGISGPKCHSHAADSLLVTLISRLDRIAWSYTSVGFTCPVCGYPELQESPRSPRSGGGSYEICPSCGFQFGVTDDDEGISTEVWRARWIEKGMRWCSAGIEEPPPEWDARVQLQRVHSAL